MSAEEGMTFVDLIADYDYEISTTYPFVIRRKDNGFLPKEYVHQQTGYIRVNLNGKPYNKHRLIGLQFIPNDDPMNKTEIDHVDHDRTNYRAENLRWVSGSTNSTNKSSHAGVVYEFIDDIPEEAIVVDFYDTRTEHHEFPEKQYYYYQDDEGNDIFYARITEDGIYRVMHINTNRLGHKHVCMRDVNLRKVNVSINKFKYLYDLL